MGLRHVFGDKPIPLVLDFLMVHKDWDYPLSQIARETGLSYRTLQAVMPALEEAGVVKQTRQLGRAKLYQLNSASPSAKKLSEYMLASDLEFAGKAARRSGKRDVVKARVPGLAGKTSAV
jgi:predicted transcriptional regulator